MPMAVLFQILAYRQITILTAPGNKPHDSNVIYSWSVNSIMPGVLKMIKHMLKFCSKCCKVFNVSLTIFLAPDVTGLSLPENAIFWLSNILGFSKTVAIKNIGKIPKKSWSCCSSQHLRKNDFPKQLFVCWLLLSFLIC